MKPSAAALTKVLLAYAHEQGRDLPWRRTRDPYAIVVSELMLQQTQVSRVIPKWHAWLERFPDWRSLAESRTSDVLAMWSGLGYNSRALRLRELAVVVMKEWSGSLPTTPEELLTLPGIGPYTAHAVASFAFDADVLAVDTNLKRVLGRYFGTPAFDFSPKPGTGRTVNGALMDLGASVCGRTPQCDACPLKESCATKGRAKHESVKRAKEKFEESDRCIRGSVLKRLLQGHASKAALQNAAAQRCVRVTEERLNRILDAMAKQGLIRKHGERVRLP